MIDEKLASFLEGNIADYIHNSAINALLNAY